MHACTTLLYMHAAQLHCPAVLGNQNCISATDLLPHTASFCLQAFVKEHLEDAAVSQRDLQRVFNLLAFFIQHHKQRGRDLPETVPLNADALVHRSLLLSIAVAYYFRLDRQLRQHFLERMAELDALAMEAQDELVPCYDMAAVVDYELELYIQAAELPQGIAPNQALRENFFCIAVCVETKTPLIIIGTPGRTWSRCTYTVMIYKPASLQCNSTYDALSSPVELTDSMLHNCNLYQMALHYFTSQEAFTMLQRCMCLVQETAKPSASRWLPTVCEAALPPASFSGSSTL